MISTITKLFAHFDINLKWLYPLTVPFCSSCRRVPSVAPIEESLSQTYNLFCVPNYDENSENLYKDFKEKKQNFRNSWAN